MAASAMVMISADRMKSVLIAPLTRSSSPAPPSGVASRCGSLPWSVPARARPFGALEAQIGAADHQQGRNRPGRECRQKQRDGQQDHQLVEQRSARDLHHDGHFARRRKSHGHISASPPRRRSPRPAALALALTACPPRRRPRPPRSWQSRHVVQQRQQSAHLCIPYPFPHPRCRKTRPRARFRPPRLHLRGESFIKHRTIERAARCWIRTRNRPRKSTCARSLALTAT